MSQALGNQRRVRGTGGITKRKIVRPNGTTYFLWVGTLAKTEGKKTYVSGRTQSEVAAKLKVLQVAPAAPVAGKQTVADYMSEWLELVCAKIQPATCRSYRGIVRVHILPAIGAIKLDKLTKADVAKMIRDRSHLSPRTLSTIRLVLQGALRVAVEDETLSRNVAVGDGVGVPPQVTTERTFLTPANVKRLLDTAKNDRLRALYFLAVNIGARQGELLGLTWSDVDFERGTISISKQLQRVGGKLILKTLKTPKSRRTIYMSAAVTAALIAHRDRQNAEREAATRWASEPNFVFRTPIGTGLEGVNVTKLFQGLVQAAKLPAMTFHDLRHTCASIRLDAGESLLSVSRLLGHGDIAITANTYSHLMPESGRAAADAMDRALAS
jgi:integrase